MKLPLMAIKSPFVGALTDSGKLNKPIPDCINDRFIKEYYLINNNVKKQLSLAIAYLLETLSNVSEKDM